MATPHKMQLHPWNEIVPRVVDLINQGAQCFQQWNCEHCGAKQTMQEPNKFYASGICEECKKITDIEKNGMNYMVLRTLTNIVDFNKYLAGLQKPDDQ